jgi:hypothetical protein
VAGKRPINADLPSAQAEAAGPEPQPRPAPTARAKRRRRPVPAALKAVAGLIAVAIVFLLAAVLGGGGSNTTDDTSAPAPTQASPEKAAAEVQTPAAEAAEDLGYPSFATNNTTRVGGSDPATIAAAVALAVFPSATPAQRPTAVTIVDEKDWRGAIAASVLMAEPLRSPLLVSSGGDLPEPTAQALAALGPRGSSEGDGTQTFVVGDAATPGELTSVPVDGPSPAALAASIAAERERISGGPPAHYVLAPEADPEFAIPAAAWAARSGDPVLFSGAEKLPAPTARLLRAHPKTTVYVLGPSSAISSKVVREAGETAGKVRRVSGEDPVSGAVALARYSDGDFGWNVNDPGHGFVVARSDAPLAAAVASPLSASGTWGPMLLTDDAGSLPPVLREYLLDVKPGYTTDPTRAFYNHVWIIGDQEGIDVNQQAEIDQLAELAKIGGGEP